MSTESNKLSSSIPTGSSSVAHPTEKLTKVSHFSASFQRRFSSRTSCSDETKTPLVSLNDAATNVDSLVSSFPSPVKFSSKPPIHKTSLFSSPGKRSLVVHHKQIEEDSELLNSAHSTIQSEKSLESTPIKDIPTSERLMPATPELQTPKRSRKSTIDDTPHKTLVKRATRTKLFPTPRKKSKLDDAENLSENSPVEDDVLGFLPESLQQDIRDEEKVATEERDANVAGARLRKKMIANSPKLFDSILLIFQSGNRSVITKQELVHKILASHCSVVDRNEVEEQLGVDGRIGPRLDFSKGSSYRGYPLSCE